MANSEEILSIRARAKSNYRAYMKMACFTFEDFCKLDDPEEAGEEIKRTMANVSFDFDHYAKLLDELHFSLQIQAEAEAKE